MTLSTQPREAAVNRRTQIRADLANKDTRGVIYIVRWERATSKDKGPQSRIYATRSGAEKCAAWVRSGGREAVVMRADLGTWSVV
jgi:hypothetical protein